MGKTCIVTGASRGIGKAICVQLSHDPDIENIVLISRSMEDLLETEKQMNSQKNIKIFAIDLQSEDDIVHTVREVYKEYTSIDILVNCAGYVDPKSLLETTSDNLFTTFNVNVLSVYILCREVTKFMRMTGGKIVNVASTAGMTPRPGWSAYAASKAALISLSNTLSVELESFGILVYCISPGRCATDLRKLLAPEEDPSTIMQPQEVAEVVQTLLSESGDVLDGQNIVIRKQTK